jgi:pyruvate formate lyase activating enzyme
MQTIRDSGRWLEVAVLVVPTVSDDPGAMRGFLRWMKANLGADTPVHLLRFWPSYKLKNLPQTPVEVLEKARALALAEGLRFVYLGNLPGHSGANTCCPHCQATLIRRLGFALAVDNTRHGACSTCGHVLPGVWRKT